MTINYYLDRRPDRKGEMRIFLYIRFDRKQLKVYTSERTKPEYWNTKISRPLKNSPGSQELTDLLESWEEEIKAITRKARSQRKQVTIEYLKNNLSFIKKRDYSFFDLWDKYIKEQGTLKSWAPGTARRYQTCRKHLDKINESYKLEFGSLNNEFLQRFINHHQAKGFTNSFTEKNLIVLKGFLNWSVINEYNTILDYKKWQVNLKKPSYDDNIVFLTIDELIRVYKLKIKNPTLQHVRDVFCFGCFTGLRHSDLQNLKKSNITNGNIEITTIKTNRRLKISLNRYAKAILDKYSDFPGPYALPVISNQKTNDYLKDLGRLSGLTESVIKINFTGNKRQETIHPKWTLLTTHVARKTFITTAVYLDIPLEVVIEITGQTLEVVRRYYKIQDKQKEREMKKFNHLKVV